MDQPASPRIFNKAARVPRVVAVLAGLLERAAERGDAEGGAAHTAFRGKALPAIPVRRYAERIYRYAGCSPACLVVAYVYLDRLARGRNVGEGDGEEETAAAVGGVIDSYTVHRLLITSVLVAAKFMDDRHHNNAYFARVGGVEVSELNVLELRLLFALRFRLNVHPDTFATYCAALECQIVMANPAVPLPAASPVDVVGDDDDEAPVMKTKADKGCDATTVVVLHSHRRHRRTTVVHNIMTTAQ